MKLNLSGSGLLFEMGVLEKNVEKLIELSPAFCSWVTKRTEHHELLRRFAIQSEQHQLLVKRLVVFHQEDSQANELRGGDMIGLKMSEIAWFATGERERQLKLIEETAPTPHQLWLGNQLVLMAMPEYYFGPLSCDAQLLRKINNFFQRALAGYYQVSWPFSIPNPAEEHF